MSNRSKDGDFNLDEELRAKIVANEEGQPIIDDHEDEKIYDDIDDLASIEAQKAAALCNVNPKIKYKKSLVDDKILLSVRNLKQFFFFGSGPSRTKLKAVSNISFDVHEGECFGIVGESGCGKTTTGRSIIKLYEITSGSVYYKGFRISAGNRWNRKEIKYTKIRLHQKLKELNLEKREKLDGLEDSQKQPIIDKYAALAKEEKEKAYAIINKQKEKIRQIKFDNRHIFDRNHINNNPSVIEARKIIKEQRGKLAEARSAHKEAVKEFQLHNDKTAPNFNEELEKINQNFADSYAKLYEEASGIIKNQKKIIDKNKRQKLVNEIQMIFQDPVDSLDPRMTVEDIIQEGLRIQGYTNKAENHQKVVEMLEKVGLVADHASRYPHEFSGGQRQRIGIARALIMNPKLLICDEPISALDVSIRAQIINLLNDLKDELGLTLIFIAHDLSVVKYFCDRIAVMYFGKIVEMASSDELFKNPLHPYTKSLLSAIPMPNPIIERNRKRIIYNPQEVHDYSVDKPSLVEIKPGHLIYCNQAELENYKKVLK